jgi:hypothetical protein
MAFHHRFEVLTAKISMLVFWVVTLCGLVGRCQYLGGTLVSASEIMSPSRHFIGLLGQVYPVAKSRKMDYF